LDSSKQQWIVDGTQTERPHQQRIETDKASIPKELNGMVWDPVTLSWKGNENDNALTGIDWGDC